MVLLYGAASMVLLCVFLFSFAWCFCMVLLYGDFVWCFCIVLLYGAVVTVHEASQTAQQRAVPEDRREGAKRTSFAHSSFSSGRHPRRPERPPRGPPRGRQDGPREHHDGPQRAQEGDFFIGAATKTTSQGFRAFPPEIAPRAPWRPPIPRRLQESPKTSQMPPRAFQEARDRHPQRLSYSSTRLLADSPGTVATWAEVH